MLFVATDLDLSTGYYEVVPEDTMIGMCPVPGQHFQETIQEGNRRIAH